MVNPALAFAGSGAAAAAAGVFAQVAAEQSWAEFGAIGLLASSSVLLVAGVLKGDILHVKSRDREDSLAKLVERVTILVEQSHAREVVHEKFMTAAIDRIVEADRDRP